QLHLPLVEASNLLTNFGGTSSLTPILGALAADSFAGRFGTIVAGSVFYQLGMLGLVVSALLPSLRPAPCPGAPAACQRASGWQLAALYLSLLCTSVGSGGLRPCVDNVGWGWGFGIPAVAMFVSIVVFVVGYPLYVRLKPGGSPFTRLAQVAAAAFKKRHVAVPEDAGMLYQDKELDAFISTNGRLLHTDQLT
ncbi:hypothetical protein ACJX0J_029270, partial [Zea mays]